MFAGDVEALDSLKKKKNLENMISVPKFTSTCEEE